MDADKIKDFLVYNFEKAIVVGVAALSGFLIWSGLGKPDITKDYQPEVLVRDATQVKNDVDQNHNETVIDPRKPTFNIAQELNNFRNPIQSKLYLPETIWEGNTLSAENVKRKDPVLSKPMGIEVSGNIASIAWRSTDGVYRLTELDPAGELDVEEKRPKRSNRRRNRRNNMDDYGGDMGDMGMGMDMGMGQGGDGYGMDDMGDMMGGGMMGGGDTGRGTGTSEAVRTLDPKNNLGYKPTTTTDLLSKKEQEPVPGIGWFIAGTAAIPHKELIDSYQEAFSYAAGYNPERRDRPLYVAYQVERADVTSKSVDELKDDDWILRDDNERTLRHALKYWSGFADEVVPSDYWVNGVTMWIPPVMLDPYAHFATNSLVPLKTKKELDLEKARLEAEEKSKNATPLGDDDFDINITGQGGGMFNSGGGGRGMDGYGGDMGDMGMGMGGMDDYGGDMGMGMGMGMGGGGSSAGRIGQPAEKNPVDYKLLRFYDFAFIPGAKRDTEAPRPGRKYVYRIRFAVNDPNFPEDANLQPKGRDLDSEAYERFIALSAESRKTKERSYKRWSEWSDVSAPVALASPDRSVVGPVKAEKSKRVQSGSRTLVYEPESPKAEIVASSFDIPLGVFVPTTMTATEGTVLSEQVEKADVVDPITLEVREVKEVEGERGPIIVKSESTIIDIKGGLPLEIVEEEEMTEPGMFLMIDSQGRLKVKQSVEEQQVYRIRSFAEERGK
ncbi:MAG: hypothetical protein AAFV88_15155 [Planctomycetota bacterium]